MNFDPLTRTLSGTAGDFDRNVLLSAVATDIAGASVVTPLQVRVANTPDAPSVGEGIADQVVAEDSGFAFTIPSDAFLDPDPGDVLAYGTSLAGELPLPDWLHFDPATRSFIGSPENADVGLYLIVVTATDLQGNRISEDFLMTVENTNDAPYLAGELADHIAAKGESFEFLVDRGIFADIDKGDTGALTLRASLASGEPLPAWLSFDPAESMFFGTPSGEDLGTLRIRVTATDPSQAGVSEEFDLTVINTNSAPIAGRAIEDQTAMEDSVFSFVIPDDAFVDLDIEDVLGFTAAQADGSQLPFWLTFDVAARSFLGTPGNAEVGSIRILVTAADPEGESATSEFGLTVVDVNDAPEFVGALPELSAVTGVALEYRLPGDLFTDIDDGDLLSVSIAGAGGTPLPGWLHFDPDTRVLTGTPAPEHRGVIDLEVVATDLRGASASAPLVIAVSGVLAGTNGADTITGAAADDLLSGGRGNDRLYGLMGEDVLAGGEGRDQLSGGEGNDLLLGQQDRDDLYGDAGNDLLIGGNKDDTLYLGSGNDIVAFNRGDGKDTVCLGEGGVTLSLGGGLAYRDLKLNKDKNDLVLETGHGDRLVLADWYAAGQSARPITLQVVAEAMAGFQQGGADPLLDDRIETFDFNALVAQFDAAPGGGPGSNKWKVMNALLDAHLAGSDSEAIGGDLAYQYGLNGTLAGIGLTAAQEVLNAPQFGAAPQALRPLAGLQQGQYRLS